jgi:hypothetical protein
MAIQIPLIRDEAVRARFIELGLLFDQFKEELQPSMPDAEIEIDSKKLFLVVLSYFVDIARYKWWHFQKEPEKALVDGTKKAAYTIYWINKLSPVYARRTGMVSAEVGIERNQVPRDASLLANVYFSISVASTFLKFAMSDILVDKLMYHMLWREESPKQYMLLFEMLDAAATGASLFNVNERRPRPSDPDTSRTP